MPPALFGMAPKLGTDHRAHNHSDNPSFMEGSIGTIHEGAVGSAEVNAGDNRGTKELIANRCWKGERHVIIGQPGI